MRRLFAAVLAGTALSLFAGSPAGAGPCIKFRRVKAGELTTPLLLKMTPKPSALLGESLDWFIEGRHVSAAACKADVVRGHIEIAQG